MAKKEARLLCPMFSNPGDTVEFAYPVTLSGATITIADAVTDIHVIKGRVSMGSAAGTALAIGATYLYGEGIEYRWQVSDWTGVGSSFKGMYVRAEAATSTAAGKSVYGQEIYGVCNNVTMTTGSLWGALFYAYNKGVAAVTINNMYAVQAELTWDASRTGDCTITTAAACVRAKITGGRVADYTKIHGYTLTIGEMDGDSQAFGNGLLMEDDAGMSGTNTLTTGINMTIGTATAISISGAMTTGGLVMTGTCASGHAIAIGTFGAPIVYTTDELIELHGQLGSVTENKPMMRVRGSTFATGDMTTGTLMTMQVQAYNVTTYDFLNIRGISVEAGAKGACELLTGGVLNAGYFKVEDLGNDLTATGDIFCMHLGWQFNTGSTISGESSYINLRKEGNINLDANSVMRFHDGSGSGVADYFLDFVAAGHPLVSADKTGNAKDYCLKCDIAGTVYNIQLYADS